MGIVVFRRDFPVSILMHIAISHTNETRYVAMHSMTEATNSHEEPVINGYIDHHSAPQNGLSKSDIAIVLTGMVLPLLTQVGHHH